MNKTYKTATVNERIRAAMDYRGIKQPALALKVGISQTAISNLLNNEKTTGGRFIVEIAKALDTDINWIKKNEGIAPWEEPREPGKIPLIEWHEIPEVYNDSSKINDKERIPLDVTFKKIENIFASYIPRIIEASGSTRDFFRPGEIVLIGPKLEPVKGQYILVSEGEDPFPEFAYFWEKDGSKMIRYPWEMPFRKINDGIKICGVIVATMNLFLKKQDTYS